MFAPEMVRYYSRCYRQRRGANFGFAPQRRKKTFVLMNFRRANTRSQSATSMDRRCSSARVRSPSIKLRKVGSTSTWGVRLLIASTGDTGDSRSGAISRGCGSSTYGRGGVVASRSSDARLLLRRSREHAVWGPVPWSSVLRWSDMYARCTFHARSLHATLHEASLYAAMPCLCIEEAELAEVGARIRFVRVGRTSVGL